MRIRELIPTATIFLLTCLPAGAVDPSAPLDVLNQARTKASSSSLNTTSLTSSFSNIGLFIMGAFGLAGIGLAGISGTKLYQASQNPEGSREHVGRSIAGIVIGAGITIIGVVIGVITNYMTGS
jgi:F0F1-type ATP synthase membrane subunit c/vacuolar-type H+-ATPase subunit K